MKVALDKTKKTTTFEKLDRGEPFYFTDSDPGALYMKCVYATTSITDVYAVGLASGFLIKTDGSEEVIPADDAVVVVNGSDIKLD